MAGRPRGTQARNVIVPVRFTKALVASLDENRGGKDRSAYIRHLVNQQELLGLRLLSLHNLRFLIDLTAGARAAIERGELAAYRADALDRLTKGQ